LLDHGYLQPDDPPDAGMIAPVRVPNREVSRWELSSSLAAMDRTPVALSIAGSDSGGGAGVAAGLRAVAGCGGHGAAAFTAITAQHTVGVEIVEPVSPKTIIAQVRLVAEDIGVDAVKIGMLGTVETVEAVVQALSYVGDAPVVIDPVMISESGA